MNHYRRMISCTLARASSCELYGWSTYVIHPPIGGGYFCLVTGIHNLYVEVSYTRPCLSGVTYGPDKFNYTQHFPKGEANGQFL